MLEIIWWFGASSTGASVFGWFSMQRWRFICALCARNPTFNDLAGIQAFVSLGVAPVAAEVPKPGQRNFGGGVNGCHSFAPRQVFARNVLLG